jgi:hypothetical protein
MCPFRVPFNVNESAITSFEGFLRRNGGQICESCTCNIRTLVLQFYFALVVQLELLFIYSTVAFSIVALALLLFGLYSRSCRENLHGVLCTYRNTMY